MTFDWQAVLRAEAEHLVRLSKDPAWAAHAKWRAEQRAEDPLWVGLADVIRQVRA